jgi:hypothetical protein
MNPDHSIDSEHPERFDDEPTEEQIEEYVAGYDKEPRNPETGLPWSVWFETQPITNLKTFNELRAILENIYTRKN